MTLSHDERRRLVSRYEAFIIDGLPELKRAGYNPTEFYRMVERYGGAFGATRRLLADPRHTSYGFQRLYEMERLEASVEYAVCLPWFSELFTPDEQEEARTRLVLHEFPLDRRLERARQSAPDWVPHLASEP